MDYRTLSTVQRPLSIIAEMPLQFVPPAADMADIGPKNSTFPAPLAALTAMGILGAVGYGINYFNPHSRPSFTPFIQDGPDLSGWSEVLPLAAVILSAAVMGGVKIWQERTHPTDSKKWRAIVVSKMSRLDESKNIIKACGEMRSLFESEEAEKKSGYNSLLAKFLESLFKGISNEEDSEMRTYGVKIYVDLAKHGSGRALFALMPDIHKTSCEGLKRDNVSPQYVCDVLAVYRAVWATFLIQENSRGYIQELEFAHMTSTQMLKEIEEMKRNLDSICNNNSIQPMECNKHYAPAKAFLEQLSQWVRKNVPPSYTRKP